MSHRDARLQVLTGQLADARRRLDEARQATGPSAAADVSLYAGAVERFERKLAAARHEVVAPALEAMRKSNVAGLQAGAAALLESLTRTDAPPRDPLPATVERTIAAFAERVRVLGPTPTLADLAEYNQALDEDGPLLAAFQATGTHPGDFVAEVTGDPTVDAAAEQVAEALYPMIHEHLLASVAATAADERALAEYQRLAGCGQAAFIASAGARSADVVPFSVPTALLVTAVLPQTPGGKLKALAAAVDAVVSGNEHLHEHLLDIWTYVVARARVARLPTLLQFIREYGDVRAPLFPVELTERALARLPHIAVPEAARPSEQDLFVVPDKSKYEPWITDGETLELIDEDQQFVDGFRVELVPSWLLDPTKLYGAVVVETGRPEDRVAVWRLRPVPGIASAKLEYVRSVFAAPAMGGLLAPQRSDRGTLLVAQTERPGMPTTVPVPDGHAEKHVTHCRTALTLRRLGVAEVSDDAMGERQTAAEQQFLEMYGAGDMPASMYRVVRRLQSAMRLLDAYPMMAPSDGVFSDVCLAAVRAMGRETASPEMLDELETRVARVKDMLRTVDEQFCDEGDAEGAIKRLQRAAGLMPDGRCGPKTLAALEAVVEEATKGK